LLKRAQSRVRASRGCLWRLVSLHPSLPALFLPPPLTPLSPRSPPPPCPSSPSLVRNSLRLLCTYSSSQRESSPRTHRQRGHPRAGRVCGSRDRPRRPPRLATAKRGRGGLCRVVSGGLVERGREGYVGYLNVVDRCICVYLETSRGALYRPLDWPPRQPLQIVCAAIRRRTSG
jgi:hypothetical protein